MTTDRGIPLTDGSLSEFQERVYLWQRDVAGQPVTRDPDKRDPKFIASQLTFIRSEWSDEFCVNWPAYRANRASLLSASAFPFMDRALAEIQIPVADDIADTAFVLLGLLNAFGITVLEDPEPLTLDRKESEWVQFIDSTIRSVLLNPAGSVDLVGTLIPSLRMLALSLEVDFWLALRAVCDSNDTKLWTPEEWQGSSHLTGHVATYVPGGLYGRCMRVKNTLGKLIKSPSFSPPNLWPAVLQPKGLSPEGGSNPPQN